MKSEEEMLCSTNKCMLGAQHVASTCKRNGGGWRGEGRREGEGGKGKS